MKKSLRFVLAILPLFMIFCLFDLCAADPVTNIPLGNDLPDFRANGVFTPQPVSDAETAMGMTAYYTGDDADIRVYRFPNGDGSTLEEFGQEEAARRNVFCNMLTDRDVPAAVLNYHDCIAGEHYIVQSYSYAVSDGFVEVQTLFKTEEITLPEGDLFLRMIREYEAAPQESGLVYDTLFRAENERLPEVRVRRFSKADFPIEAAEPALADTLSDAERALLAQDGWTAEEILSVYDAGYDLIKGEITTRNSLSLAFIGYIDSGIFKTRAVIDDGDGYLFLGAEAEAARFQHVTNALIDAISVRD